MLGKMFANIQVKQDLKITKHTHTRKKKKVRKGKLK